MSVHAEDQSESKEVEDYCAFVDEQFSHESILELLYQASEMSEV